MRQYHTRACCICMGFPEEAPGVAMNVELQNINLEDLPYLERDLSFPQKVSLAFLLFGDQHAHATYILQKLLAMARSPDAEQQHSDLLRQYVQTNPDAWRGYLIEALCIINARQALRKLGFSWAELRLQYLPQVHEVRVYVHPLLKAMYLVCEQLSVIQSGRLVLDINDKMMRRQPADGFVLDEPLRYFDYAYLEIFLLDWLTRRYLLLGDINAVGSNLQLLIEYLKFHDLHSLAQLITETYNSIATTTVQEELTLPEKFEADNVGAAVALDLNSTAVHSKRCADAVQVRRDNAGILLIINQYTFHREVSNELIPLLPELPLLKREGTNADKQRLSEVFSALGYSVEDYDNVDHLKILEYIRNACSRSRVRDSLVVCILSHGFEGAVYGCDSIPISIIDIQNVICADENLHDKPKFLIIQACQQNNKKKLTREVNASTNSPKQHANMVVAMSTVPGHLALRHSIQGSWFIQTLCETIKEQAASDHLLDILTNVIRKVSEKRGDKNEHMVPLLSTTLQKKVYLPNI